MCAAPPLRVPHSPARARASTTLTPLHLFKPTHPGTHVQTSEEVAIKLVRRGERVRVTGAS